jgi:UDPglucose 6-dehydrogenase
MQIAIVGTGYVGLVTGAVFASLGHRVICLDVDAAKVASLRAGKMPIYEPGLDNLAAKQIENGHLQFTTEYEVAIPNAQAVFICVGTPSLPTGQADTRYVEAAARSLGEHLSEGYTVLINKSTVPIGSSDWVGMIVRQGIARRGPEALGKVTFDVISNPEFLREGTALEDALNPDRIVIGAESTAAVERMRELYAPLLERCKANELEVPFVVTDRASAEMIKYAANAFLATKISFINEIANVCEKVGADVREVARGIGMDVRIGPRFLSAGIGWGGSCFPKDLASLIHTAQEYGYQAVLLQAVREVNTYQRGAIVRKLQDQLKLIKGKTICLWGLAFKPGTDDLRDAPSLQIAERLSDLGATVRAYDPQAMEAARGRLVRADLCDNPYDAAKDADAIVVVTEWPDFIQIDWDRVRGLVKKPLIIDGRNCLEPRALREYGFDCVGIGR